MPEHALRFGVTNGSGLRSESWKCWTVSGQGKRDVYVLCRRLGDSIKLSLHESGQWHVGFGSRELFDEDNLPDSRFVGMWDKPAPITRAYTLACRVHIPFDVVDIQDDNPDPDVNWEACAPSGQSVEFAIFLTERPDYGPSLVDLIRPRPNLIGTFPLEGGGAAYVVSYLRPKIALAVPSNAKPHYFKGGGGDDILNGNRAILWNAMPDGSIMFVETHVIISKP